MNIATKENKLKKNLLFLKHEAACPQKMLRAKSKAAFSSCRSLRCTNTQKFHSVLIVIGSIPYSTNFVQWQKPELTGSSFSGSAHKSISLDAVSRGSAAEIL